MKVNVGDRVVKVEFFPSLSITYFIVESRTKNTIAGKYWTRLNLSDVKIYDEEKVNKLREIRETINQLKRQAKEIYGSLESVE